jgi:hypothetical protein
MMPAPDLPFLQSDRIIFKLYACEQHLKNIKKIKSKYGDLLSNDCRISAELGVIAWILQMIDTFDCLLFRIIDKFQLSGIPIDKIELNKVVNVLSAESQKVELANELDRANHEGNWYWKVKRLRNNSLHASLLLPDASLDVIPYFEQTLVQLKEFMKNINMKEPALL